MSQNIITSAGLTRSRTGQQGNEQDDNLFASRTGDSIRLLPLLLKFFKVAALMLLVWVFGYFDFSVIWVLVGLFFYVSNTEYRKIKDAQKLFARHAVKNEEAAIKSRVEELPAWVYFPDVERAEWVNKIVLQMWPFIGDYVIKLLKSSVEPQIQNCLPDNLKPFKFTKIDLGDIPPRVGGVKAYIENVKRDEIVLDLEICYAGDCRFGVSVKGLVAGIKELTIRGNLRVILKPLCGIIPIIGGVSVFFLNKPTVDFDLTNAANILDSPLLNNSLRSVVEDQITGIMVLPNRIAFKLIDSVDITKLRYPTPQGVIRLHIIAARELKRADFGLLQKGKSDPYCKIFVGPHVFKTKVIQNDINPVWNQYFEGIIEHSEGQVVEIQVLDEDPGEDDELGRAQLDTNDIAEKGFIDSWIPLENVSTGMIHFRALWFHLSRDLSDLDKMSKAVASKNFDGSSEYLATALLVVTVDSAKSLPRLKKGTGDPSPYVTLHLGNENKKSLPKERTADPIWEQNFEFLVHDPHLQTLEAEVKDGGKGDKKLGSVSIPLKTLLTAPQMTTESPYKLNDSGPDSKLILRLSMWILTSEVPVDLQLSDIDAGDNNEEESYSKGDAGASGKPEQEIRYRGPPSGTKESPYGKIELTIRHSSHYDKLVVAVHKCMNLIGCDDDGLADPYVRIFLLPDQSETSKRKTTVVKNTINPVYDQIFEWPVSMFEAKNRTLEVSVKNSVGILSKQRTHMGITRIQLSDFDLTKEHTKWFNLGKPED